MICDVMMKRLIVFAFGLPVMVAGFSLSACAFSYDHATWRYKMTVSVQTPEGVKTGFAVREVSATREPHPLPEMHGARVRVKGEAVVVDLGKRGVLFALMRGRQTGVDYGYYIVFTAFPYPKGGGQLTSAGIKYYAHLKAAPVTLEPKDYPMFVYFKDRKDPKTVTALSATNTKDKPNYAPGETVETFSSAFGKGVSLKSVTIEMTKEPVTWGIDKWLGWLEARRKNHTPGAIGGSPERPFEDPTGTYLVSPDFVKGK